MTSNDYLKQYITELRGISFIDLANALKLGHHCVQKTVKGQRRNPNIRRAIAEHVGLDPEKTWGRGSVVYLRRMVAVEAGRVAEEKAQQARRAFLQKYDGQSVNAKNRAVNE